MTMAKEYTSLKSASGSVRIDTAHKTMMILPGLTQVFVDEKKARKYLAMSVKTTEKLFKVLFKVNVDAQGQVQPMDILGFLGNGAAASATEMGEGLM